MATTVNWDGLRELAAFGAEKGCATSLYLDLEPATTVNAGDMQTRWNSLLDGAAKSEVATRATLTHEQRQALKGDFERIRQFLANDLVREGTHGLALFCAGLDNFWRTLPLAAAVPDCAMVGSDFFLTPLVPLVGRGDGALVVQVSREQGLIFRLRGGRLEEVVDRTEDVPNQHQQGGWSQARLQRRVDNAALDHLRDVADELDRRVRRRRATQIVVVCPEEQRSDLEGFMASETRGAIAGWTSVEAHAGASELLAAAQPLLERARLDQEASAVERWREEAGRQGRAAAGWPATLEAASDGRVDMLLYQDGADCVAWRCPRCGRLAADGGKCPLDGTVLEERQAGLDLAIHQTIAHGGMVAVVRERQDLEPVGGIGALLRF